MTKIKDFVDEEKRKKERRQEEIFKFKVLAEVADPDDQMKRNPKSLFFKVCSRDNERISEGLTRDSLVSCCYEMKISMGERLSRKLLFENDRKYATRFCCPGLA